MAFGAQENDEEITGINVTPLVDIMLVLLIIFLVTAKLAASPPKGLPLELPKSASADTVQLVFAVALSADGRTAVNGQVVIRPMMYTALTYDHRLVDGREAVMFLRRLKEKIEAPIRALIEA